MATMPPSLILSICYRHSLDSFFCVVLDLSLSLFIFQMVALLATSGTRASRSLMGTAWVYCWNSMGGRGQSVIHEVEIMAWKSSFYFPCFSCLNQEKVERSWSQTKKSPCRRCVLFWGAECLHADLKGIDQRWGMGGSNTWAMVTVMDLCMMCGPWGGLRPLLGLCPLVFCDEMWDR